MTLRKFRIDNYYDGEGPIVTEAELDVPTTDELAAEGLTWQDFVDQELYSITGTGRSTGHSAYFVESVDGLEPKIKEEWC